MGLLYNVAQLLKSDVGQTREYDFESDVPLDLDDTVASDIKGHVKFTLTNFGIVATVSADANLHLTCARCLEAFQQPTHVEFEEEYQPIIEITTGLPAKAPRSETSFTITRNHTIDLSEALRQTLLLSVDMIPVCSPTCLGLCPTCGVNRNTETCTCPPIEAPNPFAALSSLLIETEK